MRRVIRNIRIGSLLVFILLPILLIPTQISPVKALTQTSALTLNTGEVEFTSGVIDVADGFAYFGTNTNPGIVVKIRLSNFTRVGSLTLDSGEGGLTSAVIDPIRGFAYFGTDTSPGMVVKVRLSNFTRVGELTLNAGESRLESAVIDTADGFVYFGSGTAYPIFNSTNPASIVKVRLSTFTRVGNLTINTNWRGFTAAVIDSGNGFAYFGTDSYPGIVVKVRLSDFTFVGNLTLRGTENHLIAAAIDNAGGFAYFGAAFNPGVLVKVRLSDLTRVAALTLPCFSGGYCYLDSVVIDSASGFAYLGTTHVLAGSLSTIRSSVLRVRLFELSIAANLTLDTGEYQLYSAIMDTSTGFAYFGTYTNPGIVAKVQFASPPDSPNTLTAVGGVGNIALAWRPPSFNADRIITGYAIYRSVTPGTEILLTRIENQTSFTDNSVTSDHTYYYKVTAMNAIGESDFSNEASATPTSPTITVTFQESNAAGGSITCSAQTYTNGQSGRFQQGSMLTCRANPASGYRFSGWSGLASGTTNPVTFNVGSGGYLMASFTRVQTTAAPLTPSMILLTTLLGSISLALFTRKRR